MRRVWKGRAENDNPYDCSVSRFPPPRPKPAGSVNPYDLNALAEDERSRRYWGNPPRRESDADARFRDAQFGIGKDST